MVRDAVPGATSLARLLARRAALGPGEVITVGVPMFQALAAVHEAGHTHGRVRPEDILIDPGGRPMLTGAGISGVLGAAGLPASDVGELAGLLLVRVGAARPARGGPRARNWPAQWLPRSRRRSRTTLSLRPPAARIAVALGRCGPAAALALRRRSDGSGRVRRQGESGEPGPAGPAGRRAPRRGKAGCGWRRGYRRRDARAAGPRDAGGATLCPGAGRLTRIPDADRRRPRACRARGADRVGRRPGISQRARGRESPVALGAPEQPRPPGAGPPGSRSGAPRRPATTRRVAGRRGRARPGPRPGLHAGRPGPAGRSGRHRRPGPRRGPEGLRRNACPLRLRPGSVAAHRGRGGRVRRADPGRPPRHRHVAALPVRRRGWPGAQAGVRAGPGRARRHAWCTPWPDGACWRSTRPAGRE